MPNLTARKWAKKYGYKSMTACIKKVYGLYPNPVDLHYQEEWATYFHIKHLEYVQEKHGIKARKELAAVRQPDGKNSVRFTWMKILRVMQDEGKLGRLLCVNRKQRGNSGARTKRERGIPIGLPHGKKNRRRKKI